VIFERKRADSAKKTSRLVFQQAVNGGSPLVNAQKHASSRRQGVRWCFLGFVPVCQRASGSSGAIFVA
jgi:hypothetical protein